MKTRLTLKLSTMLLIGATTVLLPAWAMAAITPACTSIVNNAYLDYKVGGIDQTQKNTTLAPATFVVGNKVMLSVNYKDTAAVPIVANSTAAQLVTANSYLKYAVTNEGNALQDYTFTVTTLGSGTTDVFGGANDSIDLTGGGTNVTAYVDVNNNLVYDAGTDTATTILAMNPTTTYGSNTTAGTRYVFIVPTGTGTVVAATAAQGAQAMYGLTAISNVGNGSADTVETNSTHTIYDLSAGTCSQPVVLAETLTASKSITGEAKWDGKDSAKNTFKVSTAVITIGKTVTTIWDPINFNSTPKPIPGALVKYEVTVANGSGAASATLTTITDALTGTLAFDTDLRSQALGTATPTKEHTVAAYGFKALLTGSTRTASGGGSALANNTAKYYTTANDADGIELNVANITATLATILPADTGGGAPYTAGELKAGETLVITFNAEIL